MEQFQNTLVSDKNQFAEDVQQGLSGGKKYIFSKYFYDEKGSELFNQITRHPDYYLTECELEIIERDKEELSHLFEEEPFNLIELGPGEGIKTLVLLKQLIKDAKEFSYFMIDLSPKYLSQLTQVFQKSLPSLNIQALYKDFKEGLPSIHSQKRKILLFLGSSIGNFNPQETKDFLCQMRRDLNENDYFLIGFDLRKDLDVLKNAYDDSGKITQNFNLNLLERINRELEADFQIKDFKHYASYNVYSGAMESYLISTKKQQVYSKFLNQTFDFNEFESIHVESSHKYRYSQIEQYAKTSGFKIVKNFKDSKNYFVLSLWRAQNNHSI